MRSLGYGLMFSNANLIVSEDGFSFKPKRQKIVFKSCAYFLSRIVVRKLENESKEVFRRLHGEVYEIFCMNRNEVI